MKTYWERESAWELFKRVEQSNVEKYIFVRKKSLTVYNMYAVSLTLKRRKVMNFWGWTTESWFYSSPPTV